MSAITNPHTFKNIDLDNTQFMGVFYQGPSEDEARSYRFAEREVGENLAALGLDWEDVQFHANGGCAACGTGFFHGAVVVHDGTPIAIGGICSETFGVAKYIGKAKLLARRERLAAESRGKARASAEKYLLTNPEVSEAFDSTDHYIVEDIQRKLFQYGSISEKQAELVLKIAREEAERAERQAEREAQLAEAPALAEGRFTLEGIVISTKSKPGFAYNQTVYKMLVELTDGNRVWGTIPSKIEDEVWGTKGTVKVRFDAQVERSQDDEHFGFYKRPTKAEVVLAGKGVA
jgi:hypothetical protein